MFKRLILFVLALLVLAVVAAAAIHQTRPDWYSRWLYPMKHADLITRSAGQNQLDPALVAAVIYEESSFDEAISSDAGAVGLMQLMPSTATWIAANTGGVDFRVADLKDPSVNIAYGCWYLRYLTDRYGSYELALAAYNGGTENLDKWLAEAQAQGREFSSAVDIPWPETREFIINVDETRDIYASAYAAELSAQ
ncbi:MAG: lytic transglycosylase domain-containing protein [Thermoleophilia bacterium]